MFEERDFPLLNRSLSAWSRDERRFLRALKEGSSPERPFPEKPSLCERAAFSAIRESSLLPELKRSWLRWAYRLTDTYVNAAWLRRVSRAYRKPEKGLGLGDGSPMSPRDLLFCALVHQHARQSWLDAYFESGDELRSGVFELWERRHELARRAGFDHADDVTSPTPDLAGFALEVLDATGEMARETLPAEPASLLSVALGIDAIEGWPPRMNTRSLLELLGDTGWSQGLDQEFGHWPRPLSPSSFVRGLARLGAGLMEASAIAYGCVGIMCDPYGLPNRTAGALTASLALSSTWYRQQLGLGPDRSRSYQRVMARSHLVQLRLAALAVRLRELALAGHNRLVAGYGEQCAHALGFEWSNQGAGLLPRLEVDAGQRLLGLVRGDAWHAELRAAYDEDWFKNPNALASIRECFASPQASEVDRGLLSSDLAASIALVSEAFA